MKKELESRLESIEYHLRTATDENTSAMVIRHAQADLFLTDIPYLLELVRSQAEKIQSQKNALQGADRIVKRWQHGELVNEGSGIIWREPIDTLPSGIDELNNVLAEGLKDE